MKYVEITFDKQTPQTIGTEIEISSKIDKNEVEDLEYKFIVGKGGIWNTIQEFSERYCCIWKPGSEGEYMVMVQAREKGGKKSLDYLAKEEYLIVRGEAVNAVEEELFNGMVVNERENNMENKDSISEVEFKEAIKNPEEKLVFLEVKELSDDEKEILANDTASEGITNPENIEPKDIKDEFNSDCDKNKALYETLNEDANIVSTEDLETFNEKGINIISGIATDKEEMTVGEKSSIEVRTKDEGEYLYRFYIRKKDEWDIIRDYDTNNTLKYTANEAGEKEFLIQCKRLESIENFEDFSTIKINVKDTSKIEIINFTCLNKSLIAGDKLEFAVETNIGEEAVEKGEIIVLYKFYKIHKDGKSVCIQDYSTKNHVYYKEMEAGNYRILCLAKSILSNKEYDDRAILIYEVKPYEKIKIDSFVASLNSPQASETEIIFSSEIQGGNSLLYRYKVKGPIGEDTGFIEKNEFAWKPVEEGEYEIFLYVKDINYRGEYEDLKSIEFTIEKKGKKPVKILDVVVDKEKKIIVGEPVNVMVSAEGGTKLLYAITIRKENRKLEGVDYNKSNWINFIPNQVGEYEIEIMIKDKYSKKPYDAHTFVYLKAMEYIPGEIDYIMLPYKENHVIGDAIEFECIIQNTQSVLVKYETKINGQAVEVTEFSKNKKLRFIPKIAGKYTIEVYAKNVKCQEEYDSKKQISLYVSEASPVIDTKIISNKLEGSINEELTFEVISRGGKDVCYEFYLMENNDWRKVQAYSRKHYYSFIPFAAGEYKILALAKSYYKKISYEDYDEITFYVKD